MSDRLTLDVSDLPDHAFGSRSVLWWGTLGIIAIESTVFILAIASWFYLQGTETAWPPDGTQNPEIFWPSVNLALLLVSLVPNEIVKRAAEKEHLRQVRIWLPVADLFALAFLVIRVLEYRGLHVSWDSNAYGSILWTLLSLHTIHLLTDFIDSVVLTALMFTRHAEGRRFVDVSENSFYWYFVVFAWIPIYLVLYWSPRWL